MDGGKLDNIRIYSIEEYQGTTQDKHYQFMCPRALNTKRTLCQM